MYRKDTWSEWQFTYQTLWWIHHWDSLATRRDDNNHTELAREYDSTQQDIQFTGTGQNDLTVNSITVQKAYTLTIDSQDTYWWIYFNWVWINDPVVVNPTLYSWSRPITLQFRIESSADYSTTWTSGMSWTPVSWETFTSSSWSSFRYISYDSWTDVLIWYDISTSPAPAPLETFVWWLSWATITINNTFTLSWNEVGRWDDSNGNYWFWSILLSNPYFIGIPSAQIEVMFNTTGHTVGDSRSIVFTRGALMYDLWWTPSWSFIDWETVTQSGTWATAIVKQYWLTYAFLNVSSNILTGIWSGIITWSLSWTTAYLSNVLTWVDTFTITDWISYTENNLPIDIFWHNYDWWNIYISRQWLTWHNVWDQWAITYPNVLIKTGFETRWISFPNLPFPLEWSVLYSSDIGGKSAIGIFDTSWFWWDNKTSWIVSIYTDWSQSVYLQYKDRIRTDIQNPSWYAYMHLTSWSEFTVWSSSWTSFFNLKINNNDLSYSVNWATQIFPISPWSPWDVLQTNWLQMYRWPISQTATNWLSIIGTDVWLGWLLIQDTDIGSNTFWFSLHWIEAAWNDAGIVYRPQWQWMNWLTWYAWAYADSAWYNKAWIYSTWQYQYNAIIGFYDWTGTLSNASYTMHEHNMNLAESKKTTRLSESSSGLSVYSDVIETNWTNVKHIEHYHNTNPLWSANWLSLEKVVDLLNPAQLYLIQSTDSINNRHIDEIHDIQWVEKRVWLNDWINMHTFTITTDSIKSTQYHNTRDDSATNNPTNFLYTDWLWEIQSSPLWKGTYTIPVYADDTAAWAWWLTTWNLYQTDWTWAAPLNVAWIVMVKL